MLPSPSLPTLVLSPSLTPSHHSPSYSLSLNAWLDSAYLLPGAELPLLLRPSLSLSGSPAPISLLHSPELTLTWTLADADSSSGAREHAYRTGSSSGASSVVTTSRVFLRDDQDVVQRVRVPDRAAHLSVALKAKVSLRSKPGASADVADFAAWDCPVALGGLDGFLQAFPAAASAADGSCGAGGGVEGGVEVEGEGEEEEGGPAGAPGGMDRLLLRVSLGGGEGGGRGYVIHAQGEAGESLAGRDVQVRLQHRLAGRWSRAARVRSNCEGRVALGCLCAVERVAARIVEGREEGEEGGEGVGEEEEEEDIEGGERADEHRDGGDEGPFKAGQWRVWLIPQGTCASTSSQRSSSKGQGGAEQGGAASSREGHGVCGLLSDVGTELVIEAAGGAARGGVPAAVDSEGTHGSSSSSEPVILRLPYATGADQRDSLSPAGGAVSPASADGGLPGAPWASEFALFRPLLFRRSSSSLSSSHAAADLFAGDCSHEIRVDEVSGQALPLLSLFTLLSQLAAECHLHALVLVLTGP